MINFTLSQDIKWASWLLKQHVSLMACLRKGKKIFTFNIYDLLWSEYNTDPSSQTPDTRKVFPCQDEIMLMIKVVSIWLNRGNNNWTSVWIRDTFHILCFVLSNIGSFLQIISGFGIPIMNQLMPIPYKHCTRSWSFLCLQVFGDHTQRKIDIIKLDIQHVVGF